MANALTVMMAATSGPLQNNVLERRRIVELSIEHGLWVVADLVDLHDLPLPPSKTTHAEMPSSPGADENEPAQAPMSRKDAIRHQLKVDNIELGDPIPEMKFATAVRNLAGVPEPNHRNPQPKRGWGDKHLARLARELLKTGEIPAERSP
jgi:hypothetical protein